MNTNWLSGIGLRVALQTVWQDPRKLYDFVCYCQISDTGILCGRINERISCSSGNDARSVFRADCQALKACRKCLYHAGFCRCVWKAQWPKIGHQEMTDTSCFRQVARPWRSASIFWSRLRFWVRFCKMQERLPKGSDDTLGIAWHVFAPQQLTDTPERAWYAVAPLWLCCMPEHVLQPGLLALPRRG